MNTTTLPKTQYAIQLVGPSQLRLNKEKAMYPVGPTQVMGQVEAVGLCFSDLKLLKQFHEHPRKTDIVSGIDPKVLAEIPSYLPKEKPSVPGHETVLRIVAVGKDVKHHKVGDRCLVQTDYRTLRTEGKSNAAFGYSFEGGLQEYVLMDERIIMDPITKRRFLIPVPENLSASAIALVEPWACVENSYITDERRTMKAGGKLLVVADAGCAIAGLAGAFAPEGKPTAVTALCADDSQKAAVQAMGLPVTWAASLEELAHQGYDDIVYFGVRKAAIELLNDKLAAMGIINIVTAGKKIGQPASVGVGRIHYGTTRWIGTPTSDAADSYRVIPATGEIRAGDSILVVGAGGPMGQMHVIRNVCSGVENISVVGTDFDDARLESLMAKAAPMAKARKVALRMANPQKQPVTEKFSYVALMAPVGALVAAAVRDSKPGCLINIFAGIPAPTRQDLDLDTYIANRCFLFGTSGSLLRDMDIVLAKVIRGQLDTNFSVDAVSGMAGALDGLAAVENRTLAGKILVYPALHEMGLIPLTQLAEKFPTVAAKLDNGTWTKAAEDELLKAAK